MIDTPLIKSTIKETSDQGWLITFSDLIALLLAFFVMLFAMSIVESEPWENMSKSLTARLNQDFAWDKLSALTDLNAESTAVQSAADLDYLQAVIADKISKNPLLSKALITRQPDRLIISLQSDTLFASGDADLNAEARDAISAMGDTLRYISNQINVIGHTDPDPVRGGRYKSNWELSLHRALSVVGALKSAGITRNITAFGFAESRFEASAADVDQETRYRRARRVDVVIRETQAAESGNGG